jgi:CHAT domain-containing protein
VFNDLEQYSPARQAAERAVLLSEQDVYPAVTARSYRLLGVVAKNQRQFADALRYGKRAFAIAQKIQDPTAPNYAVSIGELQFQLGQYDQAIPYFQFGVTNNTNAYAKAYSLVKLGETYGQKKNYPEALRYYQQSAMVIPIGFYNPAVTSLPKPQVIRQADQKDYLLTLIQDKADTWLSYAKATGDNRQRLQHALDTYKVADQMIDYMRWDHTAEESKLYWRQKTRSMYERAIETCYLLNDAEQAFRFFEKSRAVMLTDKLNELGARQQLSEAQAQTEKKLREAVSAQQNELAELTTDSTNYKSVSEALSEKQEKLDNFLKQLETSNPAYYRYKYDTTTTKLADLKSHLAGRNASFVTYFVGDSALYLLAVTGDRATLHRQSVRGYSQTAQEFMALLANLDSMNRNVNITRFLKLGNTLYRQLLAPLNLPEGSVVVSSDGSSIPFEVLSRSAREPDYLVNHYAFSYEYSARRLLRNKNSQSRMAGLGKRDFLGIAPVTFAATLKQVSLPRSDEALRPIADRFGSSVLLTGPRATSRAFMAEAADSRVIQLFTHATADTTNSEPLLYFADATLRLSDLGDGALTHTQLAVLAACKTGVGANQRGEGVFSLARGFAALGVPSVLTTLWSVENEATYAITKSFYKYLDEGLSKDVALQRAKQEWLRTATGADQLPNAWAGLILIGDTEPLSRPIQWAWVVGGALALLGAGGGALWWRRRRNRTLVPNTVRLTQAGTHSRAV